MPYSLVWNLKAFFQEIYIFELINAQLLGERNLVTKMVKPKEMEEKEKEREKSTFKYLFSIFTKFSDRAENCMRKKNLGRENLRFSRLASISVSLIDCQGRSIHSAGTLRESARICQINWKGTFSSPGAWSNGILRLSNEVNVFSEWRIGRGDSLYKVTILGDEEIR